MGSYCDHDIQFFAICITLVVRTFLRSFILPYRIDVYTLVHSPVVFLAWRVSSQGAICSSSALDFAAAGQTNKGHLLIHPPPIDSVIETSHLV